MLNLELGCLSCLGGQDEDAILDISRGLTSKLHALLGLSFVDCRVES